MNAIYEGTFGGPIVRDRVWFFGAGRRATSSISETLDATGVPYTSRRQQLARRSQGDGDGGAGAHGSRAAFSTTARDQNRPAFPFSIDPATLTTRRRRTGTSSATIAACRAPTAREAQFTERR